jgi:hypothetical protein
MANEGFGFVGPAYESADPYQDCQRLINWYTEFAGEDSAKSPIALLGCPGLVVEISTTYGQVRGAWTLPGGTKALWVSGNTVYLMTILTAASATAKATFQVAVVGTILTYTGPVCIRDNNNGGIAVIVDGPNGYVYNIAGNTLTQIVDAAFYGADRVAFIDGWFVFNKTGTQIFYTSTLYWNGVTAFNGTFFALKDTSSDNLVTLYENNRELWLVGERTTEIWYDAGGQNFPFSRLQGATLQVGCAAVNSITRVGGSLVWLASSERGQNYIVMTNGYQYSSISNAAIDNNLAQYNVVSDAIGFCYSEEGHEFYVITFPTEDITWCYDITTQQWHQRASYDQVTGQFHRHRSNCLINFGNHRLVGDYANGQIYTMSRQAYSDGTDPLVAIRRCPHVWNNRERVFHSSLQVEFSPGVGLQTGQGTIPEAMMRFSDDGAATFGNEHWKTIGVAGASKYRCIWRRLGQARDRVYEVQFSDPVKRDIVGATLIMEGES